MKNKCKSCGANKTLMKAGFTSLGTQKYICRVCNTRISKKYRNTEVGKIKICQAAKRMRLKYPEKHKARAILNEKVLSRKIIKPKKCSKCYKRRKLEAHHQDYSKPFEVVWVCRICHNEIK